MKSITQSFLLFINIQKALLKKGIGFLLLKPIKYSLSFLIVSLLLSCGYAPPVGTTQQPSVAPTPSIPTTPQYPTVLQYPPYPTVPQYPPAPNQSLPSRDYRSDSRDRDKNRCEDDKSCAEICDDIFRDSRDENKCGRLDPNEVYDLEDVFEVIEGPDSSSLEDLDEDALEKFMNVSIAPLIKEARGYSSSETKDFLLFIAENPDIAELFASEDSDFQFLDELLEGLLSRDTVRALSRSIDGRSESFISLSAEYGNEEALLWIHEYLIQGTNDSNAYCGGYSKCVFDKYCRIAEGNDITTGARKDLAEVNGDFEFFLEDEVGITNLPSNFDYNDYCDVKTIMEPMNIDIGHNNLSLVKTRVCLILLNKLKITYYKAY